MECLIGKAALSNSLWLRIKLVAGTSEKCDGVIIQIDNLGDSFERAAKGPSQMRKRP